MIRFRLAERIADKEFKERRQIQLLEIAADSGVGRMTLSKLLNHHGASIRTEYLDRLCRYFGCRIEDLVEYVPDEAPRAATDAKARSRAAGRQLPTASKSKGRGRTATSREHAS